jgi:predicted esterase
MARFFRRIAEGVFDVDDLQRRTMELAGFVRAASSAYSFDPGHVVAVGFSNGANIAASALLMRPDLLAAAVLFRAMVPFTPATPPSLPATPVLLLAGFHDPIVPHEQVERLARMLSDAGAHVTLEWEPTGHEMADGGVKYARQWLTDVAGWTPGLSGQSAS